LHICIIILNKPVQVKTNYLDFNQYRPNPKNRKNYLIWQEIVLSSTNALKKAVKVMDMQEKAFWLGWQMLLPGQSKRIWHLVERFGSPKTAWEASANELIKTGGCSVEFAHNLDKKKKDIEPEAEMTRLDKKGIGYITYREPSYPEPLKNIFDPPPGLFYKGNLISQDSPAVALVGSRRATHYGKTVAEKIAEELAESGLTVVSGLARGIDSSAHRGALKAGGRTIAVLGNGVDVVYPRENQSLQNDVSLSGAVISEYPLGSPPEAWHFPVRNRIISGLSRAVVVIEASERSGALITADCALEQGREVLALPGNINSPMSKGTNRLIKQGACLCEKVEDIFEEIGFGSLFRNSETKTKTLPKMSRDEENIYHLLIGNTVDLDVIIDQSGLSAQEVLSALMFLELKGLVRQLPGRLYTLRD
jgi:DNA processing protein